MGLKQGGDKDRLAVQMPEFRDIIVIKEDVKGEDVFYDVHGPSGERVYAGIVDGENGDRLAAVDVGGDVGLSNVVAEG